MSPRVLPITLALAALTTACLGNGPTAAVTEIDQVCTTEQQAVLDAHGAPDSVDDEQSDTLLVNHIAGINYWYTDSVYSFGDSSGVCLSSQAAS